MHADDWTWIWYFDSAGAIQTQGFSVFGHTADFVLVLMLLRLFKFPQWGFPKEANSDAQRAVTQGYRFPPVGAPTPQGPAGSTRSRTQPADDAPPTTLIVKGTCESDIGKAGAGDVATDKVGTGDAATDAAPRDAAPGDAARGDAGASKDKESKEMWVDLTSVVFGSSPVLRGRRTVVYDAEDPNHPGVCYVAKWSYPQVTRANEAKTVWAAREIVRNRGDDRMLDTLPDVVAFKDFADVCTEIIRAHLRSVKDPEFKRLLDVEHHGPRILRCIFEKKLEPLTYLTGLWFVRGMNDCIRCRCLC